jgi:uncharacterized membrane protein
MFHADALLAIAGMAAVSYVLRAGGLLLGDRLPTTGPWARALGALPGAVLVAVVVPAVADAGRLGVTAGAVTAAVVIRTRNLVLAMVAGVLAMALLRLLTGGW